MMMRENFGDDNLEDLFAYRDEFEKDFESCNNKIEVVTNKLDFLLQDLEKDADYI